MTVDLSRPLVAWLSGSSYRSRLLPGMCFVGLTFAGRLMVGFVDHKTGLAITRALDLRSTCMPTSYACHTRVAGMV